MNAATGITYGHVAEVALPFEEAIDAIRTALANEGFSIVADIDMAASARDKLGASFRPYRILGACNAQLAHLALSAEPQLGLIIPCNVVVQVIEGRTVVSVIDAKSMVQAIGNRSLEHIGADADARLLRALSVVARQHS